MPLSATTRGPSAVCDREVAVQPVLEQTFDDGNRALGFHAKHGFAETGGGRTIRAAACARGRLRPPADRSSAPIDHGREQRARRVEILRRDRRRPARACHVLKNFSNTSWTNCPCLRGSITSSSSGSSSRRRTCCAKNLNGQPRYVSSALTDQARAGGGDSSPWNIGASCGDRAGRISRPWSRSVRQDAGLDGIQRQRFVEKDPRRGVRRARGRRQPGARNLVEQRRRLDERLVVERERRDRGFAREADASRSRNRASAAARRSFSDGQPSAFSSVGG